MNTGRTLAALTAGLWLLAGCSAPSADPPPSSAAATPPSDDRCAGTPADAVMRLPDPLAKWGALHCTEFGHVITARDRWIWSYPGGYAPVFIPAQMVRDNPEPRGNAFYFTRIEMTPVEGAEWDVPLAPFRRLFPADPPPERVWRLDVASSMGRALRLYFLDDKEAPWGIWCPDGECRSDTIFMLLDMTKPPLPPEPPRRLPPAMAR